MKQPRKAKTIRLEEQDKAAIAALRDYYALSSDNEAIRFALRRAYREIQQQAPTHRTPQGRPIHPPDESGGFLGRSL